MNWSSCSLLSSTEGRLLLGKPEVPGNLEKAKKDATLFERRHVPDP
jgi:hypothetical protein